MNSGASPVSTMKTGDQEYEHVDYRDIDLNELMVSVDEAIALVSNESYIRDRSDLDRVEYELIRYSSPNSSVPSGPNPTPTAAPAHADKIHPKLMASLIDENAVRKQSHLYRIG